MQASRAWLPLLMLGLILLLQSSEGQSLAQNCSVDSDGVICSCEAPQNISSSLPHRCCDSLGNSFNLTDYLKQSCSRWTSGNIVAITLGLLLLLAGVVVGTVLVIRKKASLNTESCPQKPLESSGSSVLVRQPRYSSRKSCEQFTNSLNPSAAPGPPSSPGTLLYENLFLGPQSSDQNLNRHQICGGASPEPEELYMNYEDSSRSEQPIYGNMDNLAGTSDPRAPPYPEMDNEDDYVIPGC